MATRITDEDIFGPLRKGTGVSELDYRPPRPNTFRTSRYPGFWGSGDGSTPTDVPNPVAGDDDVAQAPTPDVPTSTTPLGSVTTAPPAGGVDLGGNGGTQQAEGLADAQFSGGTIDDAENWANAVKAGTAPIGQYGLLGFAAQIAEDPNSYTKDYGNWNSIPGFEDEARRYAEQNNVSPTAAQEAIKNKYKNEGTFPESYVAPPEDVAEAVAREEAGETGKSSGAGKPGGGSNSWGGGAGQTEPRDPADPATAGATPNDRTTGGGGGAGGNSGGLGGGQGSGGWGGPGGTESRDPGSEGKFAEGGIVTNQSDPNYDPDAAEMAAAKAELATETGGNRFAAPATAVRDDGQVDDERVRVDEGEAILKRDAAQQYSPDVLEALNDPELASIIDDLIEDWLDDDQQGGDGDVDDVAGDNSGLGLAGPRRPAQASAMPGQPRTRLGGINRVA